MKDEVMPTMAKMIDADALEAAQAYAKVIREAKLFSIKIEGIASC